MLNLSNGITHSRLSAVILLLTTRYINSTFDKAITVLELASESWKETKRYDWNGYEQYAGVVAAFEDLEREIEQRYATFQVRFGIPFVPILRDAKPNYQAADQWGNAKVILNEAIAKDKARVEAMNARFDKVRLSSECYLTAEWLIVYFSSLPASSLPRGTSSSPSRSRRQSMVSKKRLQVRSRFECHSVPITYLLFSASLPYHTSCCYPLRSLAPD